MPETRKAPPWDDVRPIVAALEQARKECERG
jgi:hypothetical protein